MDRTWVDVFSLLEDGGDFQILGFREVHFFGWRNFRKPCFQFEQGSCSLSTLPTTGVMSLLGMSLKNSSKNHVLLFFFREISPRPEFTCSERILFWYGKYATTACTADFVILTQHFWKVSLCPPKMADGSGVVLKYPSWWQGPLKWKEWWS